MFTGIVRHVGEVQGVQAGAVGKQITVDLGDLVDGLKLGDSVAVSGVCLTVSALSGTRAIFDVVAETLERTTLGLLRVGARVNLERSLRLGDTLDGHLVQGHVDGKATVRAIRKSRGHIVELAADSAMTDQMVAKGSVCVDGISLTLVDVADGRFRVALIPTTLSGTTLAALTVGAEVNIETDVIGKYVRKHLDEFSGRGGGLTMEKLKNAGFF